MGFTPVIPNSDRCLALLHSFPFGVIFLNLDESIAKSHAFCNIYKRHNDTLTHISITKVLSDVGWCIHQLLMEVLPTDSLLSQTIPKIGHKQTYTLSVWCRVQYRILTIDIHLHHCSLTSWHRWAWRWIQSSDQKGSQQICVNNLSINQLHLQQEDSTMWIAIKTLKDISSIKKIVSKPKNANRWVDGSGHCVEWMEGIDRSNRRIPTAKLYSQYLISWARVVLDIGLVTSMIWGWTMQVVSIVEISLYHVLCLLLFRGWAYGCWSRWKFRKYRRENHWRFHK